MLLEHPTGPKLHFLEFFVHATTPTPPPTASNKSGQPAAMFALREAVSLTLVTGQDISSWSKLRQQIFISNLDLRAKIRHCFIL